jgi:hypothetical protein
MLGIWGQHHRAHGIVRFAFGVLGFEFCVTRSQCRSTQNPKLKTFTWQSRSRPLLKYRPERKYSSGDPTRIGEEAL